LKNGLGTGQFNLSILGLFSPIDYSDDRVVDKLGLSEDRVVDKFAELLLLLSLCPDSRSNFFFSPLLGLS